MHYIVSLSGGVSSAVAADLTIKRYGREKVTLWIADTKAEDPDLWRFVDDLMGRWGGKLHYYCDGRTPEQVAEERGIIPNQKIAPCTYELKIKPFTDWLERHSRPVTVIFGFNWSEMHRIDQRRYWHRYSGKPRPPTGYARRIAGVYEDYPLLWKPVVYNAFDYCRDEMGIGIPYLYTIGFDHNNCGGACWRQSIRNWLIARNELPDRFLRKAEWELSQREKLGTDHTIVRDQSGGKVTPLPLIDLLDRKRVRRQPGDDLQTSMFEDNANCICSY